jgi:hypothetical protein
MDPTLENFKNVLGTKYILGGFSERLFDPLLDKLKFKQDPEARWNLLVQLHNEGFFRGTNNLYVTFTLQFIKRKDIWSKKRNSNNYKANPQKP